jgi:Fe-S-cluster-containing dehydrogenase component
VRLHADSARCSGCDACRLACALHLFGENNPRRGALRVLPRFPRPGDFEVRVCTQCGECAQACPEGAILLDVARGVYTVDPARCTLCLACLEACPHGVVFTGDGVGHVWKCDLCGECRVVCGPGVLRVAD